MIFKKSKSVIRIFLAIMIGIQGFRASSQEAADYLTVNNKTYAYFISHNWDSLILCGNAGLNNGIDYYYLRLRLGTACFEKQKYTKALEHFKKALEFNRDDSYSIEYLYYAYLNSGRKSDANHVLKSYPLVFSGKVNDGFPKEIYADAGVYLTKAGSGEIPENDVSDGSILWSESTVARQINYFGSGFSYAPGKNFILTHYYGNLGIDNEKKIRIGSGILTDKYRLNQNQVYLNANWRVGNGAVIIPALHILTVDFATVFSSYDAKAEKVTLSRNEVSLKNYAVSIAFDKRFSFTGFNFFASFSNLNKTTQKQAGLTISTFPFGNLNLYTLTTLTLHNERNSGNLVFEQKAGGKIFNFLWIDGFITFGQIKNYTEQNAFVIHNMTDAVNMRYGGSLIFTAKKIQFTCKYQKQELTADYLFYKTGVETKQFKYKSSQFLLSISKKF